MTEKKIYIGSNGPYLFEDDELIADEDSDFDGELRHCIVSNRQGLITEAPTEDDHILRLSDANDRILAPLAVTDIDDPSIELLEKAGIPGTLVLVYQIKDTGDESTLYEWDTANSSGADIPYVVAGSTGFWNAIAGKYTNTDYSRYTESSMVIEGGLISEGTVGTVTVSAIKALLRTGIETTDPLVYVSLAEQANKVIGSADIKYHVGFDYNNGSPQVSVQIASFNRTTEIGLGTCMKDTSTPVRVHFANAGMRLQDGVAKLQQRATSLRRTELASGCAIADVGGATRQFNIQKGIVYHGIYRMTPFDAAPYNPYISGDDGYFLVYGDTATGFTISDGTDTVINNTQYWNTTTHALDNVKNKQFACHWVYIHTDDEHVYVVLGNDSYKLAEAQLAQPPGDLPIEISDFGLLLGCIIIERNATAFELVQMVTDTFFTGSAVGIHNSLGGLNDGDYKHLLEVEYTEISEWLDNVVLGSDGLTSVPEMVLVPRAAALSDVVGGFYFSDIDTSVYVCTSAT